MVCELATLRCIFFLLYSYSSYSPNLDSRDAVQRRADLLFQSERAVCLALHRRGSQELKSLAVCRHVPSGSNVHPSRIPIFGSG